MGLFIIFSHRKACTGSVNRQCDHLKAIVRTSSPSLLLLHSAQPRPFAPYSCLKLVELAQQFFPPGVVQSLSGDDELGRWLTSHEGVNKISFTGSIAAGKKVMES